MIDRELATRVKDFAEPAVVEVRVAPVRLTDAVDVLQSPILPGVQPGSSWSLRVRNGA